MVTVTESSQLVSLADAVRGWVRERHRAKRLERSFLPRLGQPTRESLNILLVDIGGTHTRSTLQSGAIDNVHYRLLLDIGNEALFVSGVQKGIERFAAQLASSIAQRSAEPIDGLGVIWSNQFAAEPLSRGRVRGVGGKISGVQQGSYLKGEWFLDQLADGDNLGVLLLEAFERHGFSPTRFILANDTVACANALPGSCGGVVASTGANATVLSAEGELLNSEVGGLFMVGRRYLEEFELDVNAESCPLELLIGGAFLPRIISRCLAVPLPTMYEVAALLMRPGLSASVERSCRRRIQRAGELAGLLIVAAHALMDLSVDTATTIVVDSSLARAFPDFRNGITASSALLQPGTTLAFVTSRQLDNGQELSVPTMGLGLSFFESAAGQYSANADV